MTAQPHLLVYGFGPKAEFEGRLVGALERIQDVGESRVLDGLFVANDNETGELAAIDLQSPGGAGAVARLLTFRLDAGARRKATERALGDSGSVPADVVRTIGRTLQPGAAILALLIERPESSELDDAVARTGGSLLSDELVDGASLAELAPTLLDLFRSRPLPD